MRIMRVVAAGAVLAATMSSGVAAAATPELSTSDQLNTRRYVSAGDRAYVMGFQDGGFSAQGWHVTGEMGGVISQPLKLVDGVWFAVDGQWLGPASKFTSGWGYTRMQFPDAAGLKVTRTDFAPDGHRAGLFGLRLRNDRGTAKTVEVAVDAHSDVHLALPVGLDHAQRERVQRGRHGHVQRRLARVPGHRHGGVGRPRLGGRGRLGPRPGRRRGRRRPPRPAVTDPRRRAPPSRSSSATTARRQGRQAASCAIGSRFPRHGAKTLWIAVAGSTRGAAGARAELDGALNAPARALAAKIASRKRLGGHTKLSLPGDRRAGAGHRLGQAEHRRPDPARRRPADPRRQRGQGLPGPARHRPARALDRGRLSGLPVDLRDRRRVHGVRVRDRRAVRGDQGPRARAARRLGDPQRRLRQGGARDRRRRLGLLRQPQAAPATPTRPRSSRASSR